MLKKGCECCLCPINLKSAIGEISNVTTNKNEFTLVYIPSGSPVPSIRPVCLIPFVRHIRGN